MGSCRPRGLATRVERHDPIPLSVRAVCIPLVHGITLCGTRSVLAVWISPHLLLTRVWVGSREGCMPSMSVACVHACVRVSVCA